MFFSKSSSQKPQYLVVGLGNPGKQYEHTRHNAGFEALDAYANLFQTKITRARFDALTAQVIICERSVLLMKPQTYMNLSGVAVQKASAYYQIPPENILVLFDDISLSVGRLRLRKQGSAGGHNGIKSIISSIGTTFPRIKIGVGEKPHPSYDLADWVLSRFTKEEQALLCQKHAEIADAITLFVKQEFEQAQSKYNIK